MLLDEMLNKAIIPFPKPLNLKGAEKLLKYVSENIPGNVNYHVEQYKSFLYDNKKKKSIKDNGTLKISGRINSLDKIMEFDTVMLEPWEKDPSYVASIKFQLIPGFESRDYERVFPLWEDVRKLVNKYFNEVLKENN